MVSQLTVQPRQTKYCTSILEFIAEIRHASNSEILSYLRKSYPDISATTVHRATTRLSERGEIGVAPNMIDGSMRYDTNTSPHDHFLCSSCGVLRDTDIKEIILPIVEESIGDCRISGRLTISGLCKNCINTNQED